MIVNAQVLPWHRFLRANPATNPLAEPNPEERPQIQPVPPEPPRKPFWGPRLAAGIAAIIVAGIVIWSQQSSSTQTGGGPPALNISTAPAVVSDFESRLRASGTVAAKDFFGIRAPRLQGGRDAGRASNSMVLIHLAEAGSIVKPGDVVAEFENQWIIDHLDDTRSTLTRSLADLEKKRAEIMIAKESDQQRLRQTQATLDKAQLDLRTAQVRSEIEAEILALAVKEAEAAYKQMQAEVKLREGYHDADLKREELAVRANQIHVQRHEGDLAKMQMTTPLGGLVVLETMRRNGEFEQVKLGDEVNPGTLFMRVVNLDEMVVSGTINQTDSQKVLIGQPAEVRLDAYPDVVLTGHVASIGALATSGGGENYNRSGGSGEYVKAVSIEVAIDEEDARVLPDLSASADILLAKQTGALLVPRSALLQKGDETFVEVREGNRFREQAIELGPMNPNQAVVVGGLQEGQEVRTSFVSGT